MLHVEQAPTGLEYSLAKREQKANTLVFNSIEEMMYSIYKAKRINREQGNGRETVSVSMRKANLKLVKNEDYYQCPTCGFIIGPPKVIRDDKLRCNIYLCRICDQAYEKFI